jgi:Spherulation-specific family 4
MIRVVCTCGRAFKAEDRHAGKQTKCPECGAGLTIGPATPPGSTGSDAKEAPPWWFPSDPTTPAERATAPTRSGSDPGSDAVNTVVLPPGYSPKPRSSSQSFPAGASINTQVSPPNATFGAHMSVPGHSWLASKKSWLVATGTIALLVLAGGFALWFRSPPPGAAGVSAGPRTVESDRPNNAVAGTVSQPSTPDANPTSSEGTISGKSTSDTLGDASPSRPQVDGAGRPKPIPAGASRRLCLLVPAYIYPGGDGRKEWQRLIDAASKVEIVAIANPNSGPGSERNIDYAAIFTEASSHGVTLVGYVSTDYGNRPQAEIKNDVDTWIRFYPQVRGFFFDQQPSESRDAAQFAELRDFVKRRIPNCLVINNPGVPCDEAYLARGVSNVTCVFVNYNGFEQFELPTTLKAYDPSRFAAMPYNIPDIETMRAVVKDAIIKRIGYLYISDAKPPNQWGKLPVYWEAEVDAVSRVR